MSSVRVVAVSGNFSAPSRTLTLTRQIVNALDQELVAESHLFELSSLAASVGKALCRRDVSPEAARALGLVESAGLLVVATPVYRGSYAGLFKHLFDLIDQDALIDVPVILAATGGSERHCLVIEHQLRPLFSFFQAITVPIGIYATPADFSDGQISSAQVLARIELAARQAAKLVRHRLPNAAERHLLQSAISLQGSPPQP